MSKFQIFFTARTAILQRDQATLPVCFYKTSSSPRGKDRKPANFPYKHVSEFKSDVRWFASDFFLVIAWDDRSQEEKDWQEPT